MDIDNKINFPQWPYFSPEDSAEVGKVLQSGKVNYWTGNQGKTFEKEFAEFFGVNYAIAVANGTVALELALRALDIGPNDEVIVPARTFIATASAVIAVGATPVCVDVELSTQNISAQTIEPHITTRTRAIIVVHLAGLAADLAPIKKLAHHHNLYLIEDCAQAHGASYENQLVGSLSDIATFSFCQDKIMSTGGEGGMVLTHNETWYQKMWAYKDHGKSYLKMQKLSQLPPNNSVNYYWCHTKFGSNYRLTEMQAVIGRLQLAKLKQWVDKRQKNAAILHEYFKDLSAVYLPQWSYNATHAYYKYYLFLQPDQLLLGITREDLLKKIRAQNIPCYSGVCPEIYREEAFLHQGLALSQNFSNAHQLGKTSIMLLVHPTLEAVHMHYQGEIIRQILLEVSHEK